MNKKTIGEYIFDSFNHVALVALGLICLYPMLYVIFASVSDPVYLIRHEGILLKPLGFTFAGYDIVFQNPNIITGYRNTIIYVVAGTLLNIFMTSLGAYVLSRKQLMLKKTMTIMIIFTMYFSGGLIPHFLLVKGLGMYNSPLAVIIPQAITTYNLIVLTTAFKAIPGELEESAKIDGANDFTILFRIILPAAKASVAVIVLFYAVARWNAWFAAMIFMKDRELYPLQLLLREILIANSAAGNMSGMADIAEEGKPMIDLIIKYSTIVIATVPILFIYPFCQKYFVKGVMVGSVKG